MAKPSVPGAYRIDRLALIGGRPALDFANTAGNHAGEHPSDWLTSYGELAAWAVRAGILSWADQTALARIALRHPRKAAKALAHAREVRELLYRILTRVAHGNAPVAADIEGLRDEWIAALAAAAAWWSAGLELSFRVGPDHLATPVHAVVLDAIDLLRSPDVGRVRQCGNDPCGWLFLDRSRNGSRRWCSSADCGNQTRVRRFRRRQHA